MQVTIVVAVARNRVIGLDGGIPWRLRTDQRRFRRLTLDKPVVMGRKTWESLPGALEQRRNLVLTHDPDYRAEGATVVHSFEAALEAAKPAEELMVIGAYATALPHADRIELTEVSADIEGDTFFPELDPAEWIEVSRERIEPGEHDDWPMEFVTLKRR